MNLNLLTNLFELKNILFLVLILNVIMSLITLFLYYSDKKKAIKGKWRTKEKTLLLFPWLFGAFGGIIGVFGLRHKTKHWYFVVNNILACIIHVVIIVICLVYFIK